MVYRPTLHFPLPKKLLVSNVDTIVSSSSQMSVVSLQVIQ